MGDGRNQFGIKELSINPEGRTPDQGVDLFCDPPLPCRQGAIVLRNLDTRFMAPLKLNVSDCNP